MIRSARLFALFLFLCFSTLEAVTHAATPAATHAVHATHANNAAAGPTVAHTAAASTAILSNLYSFNAHVDGNLPYANLVQGSDGNFYGSAAEGGDNGFGSIFKVSPAGVYTVLYSFTEGDAGGNGSYTGVIFGSDGNLYGTANGGANGYGMVYKMTLSGTFSTLYSFTNGSDGGAPHAGLVEGSDGNFYSNTTTGGLGVGTIFKITPTGIFTTLHTFTGTDVDGGSPYAGMIEGSDGSFYGTTNNAYVSWYGIGTIFKITSDGVFTNLYNFKGGDSGGNPDGALVEAQDGSFYGSTHNFGLYKDDDDETGQGVLFKVTPAGDFTTIYEFTGNADGGSPEGTLALASDGNFYGTTTAGGTLFQVTPSGALTTLGAFTPYAESLSGPIVGSDGNLYGTTANGGASGSGAIFKAVLSPALAAPVQLSFSTDTLPLGSSATLTWNDVNAFSNTLQHCIAAVQNAAPGAGDWKGLQVGTLSSGAYTGSATITPTASGTYTYALTCGGTISGFTSLTVPPMTFPTTSIPDGKAGTAYSATLTEANGLAPFTWSVASGTLPAGITLDPATGILAGTPTASGTSSFTIQVKDSESAPATLSAALSLTVATTTPTLGASSSTLTITAAGGSTGTVLALSGFASNAFTLSCSGLPAKAACVFGNVSGTQAYATTMLQITTDGGFQSQLSHPRSSFPASYALVLPGLLALLGLARMRRSSTLPRLLLLMLLLFSAAAGFTGCSNNNTVAKVYSTPAGTSSVTVTVAAGDQSATTTLKLTVQ